MLLNAGHLQDGYSKLKYGYRLDRKMINSFTGYSILDCVEECLRTTRCKSVSYYKGANYCEINYENKTTAPDRYEQDTGWIYSEKEHWDKNITGACMNANCLDNQKCNSLPFGKYECIPSDCGIPYVEGADINSSDRWDAIGIRRQMHLKCYKEFKQTGSGILSCPTSGIWTADLRCGTFQIIFNVDANNTAPVILSL
ncbi:uncharacterized protein LOC133199108 [Saccostrea echinata]|uniref:uncharacterized protein LOC133199108 n=1 Tax=Saccostrea echinata TaxID=191078 RepID=UPI002A83B6FF|nr:uncharacterized protein LOC133199108 [Saccostrea echinata]